MKLLIAGSRSLTNINTNTILEVVNDFLSEIQAAPCTEIISGGATGIDQTGEQFAKDFNLKIKQFLPNWTKHGKKAGILRNKEMVEYCNAAVIFYDGTSKGTYNTIEVLKKSDKPYVVVLIEE